MSVAFLFCVGGLPLITEWPVAGVHLGRLIQQLSSWWWACDHAMSKADTQKRGDSGEEGHTREGRNRDTLLRCDRIERSGWEPFAGPRCADTGAGQLSKTSSQTLATGASKALLPLCSGLVRFWVT